MMLSIAVTSRVTIHRRIVRVQIKSLLKTQTLWRTFQPVADNQRLVKWVS